MSTPYNDLCTRITQLEVQNQQLKTHVDNLQNRYTAALALLAEMETKTRQSRQMPWAPLETAPRNGRPILACRNNGCGWEYAVLWWREDPVYPWVSGSDSYPEDRFDYWVSLLDPPK